KSALIRSTRSRSRWQRIQRDEAPQVRAATDQSQVAPVFTADTDRPSRSHLTRRIRGPEEDGRRPIIVALPRAATLDVAQEAIPAIADTSGDRRQRSELAVIGDAQFARAVVAALGIDPGVVALDAGQKAADELIVAARLHA